MSELKPCPFCGGSHITEWEVTTFSVDSSYCMFGCADCRIGFDDGRDEENIRTWNTRNDIADELAEALGNIAKQQLESEMDESNGRDFQYAYREMILVARAALAKYRETET